jgi:hypothetical protein
VPEIQDINNDVWATINKVVDNVTAYNVAKLQVRTTAAPSGRVDSNTFNPIPGTQGPYPQADAKTTPTSVQTMRAMPALTWMWIAGIFLAGYLLIRR